MSFSNQDIRTLRQRLGWSMAEMARQMGCTTDLIQKWEAGGMVPDQDALNQLRYLRSRVEVNRTKMSERPVIELEMEVRQISQLTHRDLLKDS